MLLVSALLVAWLVLNVALLGAAALANHRGQQAARRLDATGPAAPVVALFR
jgi:hypothetical protein